jgi:Fe-S cluster assembly protein SufB
MTDTRDDAGTEMSSAERAARAMNEDYDARYGFHDDIEYDFKSKKGVDHGIVEMISRYKNEPQWMNDERHRALDVFLSKPMPTWGSTQLLGEIDFDNIHYFVRAGDRDARDWDDVPDQVKQTFEKLGIPEAERKFLAGVTAQYESEVVYHSIREDLEKQGVIFTDMDSGLRDYEEIVHEHFGTVIPAEDNKFSALNTAVWSGGSFVYVPPGRKVTVPLQAYFRINTENMGQFERTLIIADEGSSVHYIEGCTAPSYTTDSLHSAVVELIARKDSTIRYTTIQNWSKNVYNLVTKRAVAHERARVEWIDGNLGSKLTMKYPAVYLVGEGAHAEIISVALSGADQHQVAGSKVVHAAPRTTSVVTSKSISKDGGRGSYRGLVKVHEGAEGSKVNVVCDALLLDEASRSDTYPTMEVDEKQVQIEHEATVSKVGEEQLFYLQSRGLDEQAAKSMIVNGFMEPFVRELPMEYAVELNRLVELEMEGSVG